MAVSPGFKIKAASVLSPNFDERQFSGGEEGDPIHIGAIVSGSVDLNSATQGDDSGEIYDEFRTIISQNPMHSFTTKDIRSALAAAGAAGRCIQGGANEGVALYFQKVDECIGRIAATSGSHAAYLIRKSLLIPQNLTAQVGADTTISLMCMGLAVDEDTSPIQWVFNSQLPTVDNSPQSFVTYQYTLGLCSIALDTDCDGESEIVIELDDLQSVVIDFGIQYSARNGPGSIWPLLATIDKIQPRISFVTNKLTLFDDTTGIALLGRRVLNKGPLPAETIIQLRARANCAGASPFASNATPIHINFRATGLLHAQQPASASGFADAQLTLILEGHLNSELYPGGEYAALIPTWDVAYDPAPGVA